MQVKNGLHDMVTKNMFILVCLPVSPSLTQFGEIGSDYPEFTIIVP